MAAFGPSGGGSGSGSGGGGDPSLTDPTVNIIREMIVVQDTGLLSILAPVIVLVTDGNLGRSMTIFSNSTTEFA